MSSTATSRTRPAATPGQHASRAPSGRRQTLARAVAFEWVKLRTLRANWIGMVSVVLILMGFGALAAAMSTGSVSAPDGGGPPTADGPLATVLTGADLAVLIAGVLGSVAGAREHSSRMIGATIAAVPRRWQVVVSKATAFGLLVLGTAAIGVLAAYAVGTAVLDASGAPTAARNDAGVLGELFGMAGYITAIALIGLGLGVVLRSVAGSIGAVVAGVMLLPALAGALLPEGWDPLLQYFPSSAASAFTTVAPAGAETLSATAGALVLVGWVTAALLAAALTLTRRDV